MRKDKHFTQRDFELHWKFQRKRRGIEEEENSFQYQFLQDSQGKKMVDYIGRYENLKEDLDGIFQVVGLENVEIPVANKSHGKSLNYRDYYQEETKVLVAEKYKKDIELLGYEF